MLQWFIDRVDWGSNSIFLPSLQEMLAKSSAISACPRPNFSGCIQLGACGETQILPMNPDLPADLFTSCLTTPIRVALRWFVLQNKDRLSPNITLDMMDKYVMLMRVIFCACSLVRRSVSRCYATNFQLYLGFQDS